MDQQKSMYPHPDPSYPGGENAGYPHQTPYPPPQYPTSNEHYPMPQPEMHQYVPPPIMTQPTSTTSKYEEKSP